MVSEEIRAMIPDYVRGMLTVGEAREVEAALAAFPEISGELEAARVYYSALNQIPEVRASAGLLRKVNHGIDYKPLGQRLRSFLFEPLYIKLPIELAGAVACAFVVVMVFNPLRLPTKERLLATDNTLVMNEMEPPSAAETVPQAGPIHQPGKSAAQPFGQAADKTAGQEASKKEEAPQRPEAASIAESAPVPAPASAPLAAPAEAVAMAMEQKAEIPAAAMTMRKPAAPSTGRIDAIPDLNELKAKKASPAAPAAAPVAQAPAAAPAAAVAEEPASVPPAATAAAVPAPAARMKEMTRAAPVAAAPVQTTEEIGTIELAASSAEGTVEASSASAGSANAALLILRTYDPYCKTAIRSGKQTFVCTFRPDRLSALISDLGQSFAVTTHLFPYDTQHIKRVTVLFILQ